MKNQFIFSTLMFLSMLFMFLGDLLEKNYIFMIVMLLLTIAWAVLAAIDIKRIRKNKIEE